MNEFSLNLTTAIGDKWLVSNLLGEFDKDPETALKAYAQGAVEALNEQLFNNEELFNQLFPDGDVSRNDLKSFFGVLYLMVGQKLIEEL